MGTAATKIALIHAARCHKSSWNFRANIPHPHSTRRLTSDMYFRIWVESMIIACETLADKPLVSLL